MYFQSLFSYFTSENSKIHSYESKGMSEGSIKYFSTGIVLIHK